jgi:hypothetical protein
MQASLGRMCMCSRRSSSIRSGSKGSSMRGLDDRMLGLGSSDET